MWWLAACAETEALQGPGPVPERAPSAPAVLGEEQYLAVIMGRNLFDMSLLDRGDDDGELPAPELRLVATITALPVEYSLAAIATESSPNLPTLYALNDAVGDRRVWSIEDDRVGLRGPGGVIEFLSLETGKLLSEVMQCVTIQRRGRDEELCLPHPATCCDRPRGGILRRPDH